MRSCQPEPSAWKCANTSLSIFSVTSSRVFSIEGLSTAVAVFFVAGLNQSSAPSLGLTGLRGVVASLYPCCLVTHPLAAGQQSRDFRSKALWRDLCEVQR